jgi:hypothetical protein
MAKNTLLVLVGALLILSLGVSPGQAGRTSLYLDAAALTTFTPEDPSLGAYYLLTFSLPPEALRAKWMYLEFYLDVSAREHEDANDPTPLLDVFALKPSEGYTGSLDPAQFEALSVPMTRPLSLGENRRVVIDVTEIVHRRAAEPAAMCALLLGSLSGSRDGLFTIKTGCLDRPGIARVTIFD